MLDLMSTPATPSPVPAPGGIPGSDLPGPYGVGEYASALRTKLRSFAHVQLVGELVNRRHRRDPLRGVAGGLGIDPRPHGRGRRSGGASYRRCAGGRGRRL